EGALEALAQGRHAALAGADRLDVEQLGVIARRQLGLGPRRRAVEADRDREAGAAVELPRAALELTVAGRLDHGDVAVHQLGRVGARDLVARVLVIDGERRDPARGRAD